MGLERQIFSTDQVNLLLQAADTLGKARIADSNLNHPNLVQGVALTLTNAQLSTSPFKVGFPFRAVWVQQATDSTVSINLKVGTRDSFQTSIPMGKNDAFVLPYPIGEAYIDWAAQAGKTINLIFFVDGEFRPGSQISVINGGVSITEGSAVSLGAQVTLSAATAAPIAPALSTRNTCLIENKTGAVLYVGDSSITNSGATEGIKLLAGGQIVWKNTGALYGYSVAGGVVSRIEEA